MTDRWDTLKLSRADWYSIKEAIEAADAKPTFDLPPHLDEHEIVQLLRKFQKTGEHRYLDKATRRLTGAGGQSWVALWKS